MYQDDARILVLRPWAPADVDALVDALYASLPALQAFMPWAHAPLTRESEYSVVAGFVGDYLAGREYVFGMFSEQGEVLGGIGLHPRVLLNPQALEVGYWCNTRHAGQGWTTLAVRMLVVLAFDHFGCDRLQVTFDALNPASGRVAEKCGFVREGTVRNVLATMPAELRAAGYRASPEQHLHALVPSDLPRLPWLPEVRARTRIYDALGAPGGAGGAGGAPTGPAVG